VSTNVEPHEAQAILDAVQPVADRDGVGDVQPRDFARPLRLSDPALEQLRRKVQAVLADCEKELSRALRGEHALELVELGEQSVEGLFDELAEPFALVRFAVDGQPAWVRWDVAGAVAAVEVALGASAPAGGERALSAVERGLLDRLLSSVARRIGAALGLQIGPGHVVEAPEEAGSWADGGPGADRARLRVHLSLDGPGGSSGLDLWLPGIGAEPEPGAALPATLPAHLDQVTVLLAARLGARDVPLAELLAIEEGDVIPLETSSEALLDVLAEDVPCAQARLGCSAGRLALRIETLGPPREDST